MHLTRTDLQCSGDTGIARVGQIHTNDFSELAQIGRAQTEAQLRVCLRQ